METSTLDKIIQAGVQAPSADNSQPWKYHWTNDELHLWIDEQRSGGFSDRNYLLSDLAIGACMENMRIMAASEGYSSKIEYLPDPDQPLLGCRMLFTPDANSEQALAQAIPARHTDRSFPWSGDVSSEIKKRLGHALNPFPGVRLIWIDDRQTRKNALKALHLAESLRFSVQELHNELFASIRFSCGWKLSSKEGLPPSTLRVEPPMRPLFRGLRHWTVMKYLNWIGASTILGFRSAVLPAMLSPQLCLLATEKSDRTSIIQAGQALERFWLSATEQHLTVQPYAAPGILSLGYVEPRTGRDKIAHLKQLMAQLTENGNGLIFFRLGHTKKTTPFRTERRSPASFRIQREG